ncbi:selenium-dependent molybdenum cofactor biosynthesis protein YqeB [Desulfogranum mediterraneum]|uniref:selenium-dependent molybdenum cofactor biosynthesis protein YqeB n=1 Tax=Desulfogranum mediterraneum TaxID=160661 RepID=UPI0003F78F94|nr:selenium-dependent molybdenum cofactor biosynthesis protein YqeB [Desulfogranum mediterraneum]
MRRLESRGVVVVRGGGDIASGTIHRLHRCGFRLLVLESARPTAIRRSVAFSEAVSQGEATVEGVRAVLITKLSQAGELWAQGEIPLLVDPQAHCLAELYPDALVDAILAKKNRGSHRAMAAVTIGLGPGFSAGEEVDAVIETARGHDLGRVILQGPASANSGIPGEINGFTTERVVYASLGGTLRVRRQIGEEVIQGETLAWIADQPVPAPISGVVRGILPSGFAVRPGLKMADIDPRPGSRAHCQTISDKARTISGGVLEALFFLQQRQVAQDE